MGKAEVITVIYSEQFRKEMVNYPDEDLRLIGRFVLHLNSYGFEGLEGRNKPSDNVPFNDPDYVAKSEYAKEYNLWHYHIGIPHYDKSKPFGDRTSEYVLHYRKVDSTTIKIVDLSSHPPFKLPSKLYLN